MREVAETEPETENDHRRQPIRLLLSGGGHRANLGSLGAVAYLLHTNRWSTVTEIASVSGGSIANAALASAAPSDDPWKTLSKTIDRIDEDRGRLWATPRRKALLFGFSFAFIGILAAVIVAIGFGPDLPAAISVLVGLAVLPLCFRLGGLAASMLLEDFISVVCGGINDELREDPEHPRTHLFLSSGLSSATPYAFWSGRRWNHAADVAWGAELQAPYTVIDAALASVSLPFLGRVRSPRDSDDPEVLDGGELLVDGGVSGIFGDQFAAPFRRNASDTYRSTETKIIAIDAGRHVTSPGPLSRRLRQFSVTMTLLRWLKASLEATYVNDLLDLGAQNVVRIAEDDSPLVNAELPDTTNNAETMAPAFALRLGTQSPAPQRDADVQNRLRELRERVSTTSLTNLNAQRIAEAITAGFVATMISLEPTSDPYAIADALSYTEEKLALDQRLSSTWAGLG